jgi:hypothetical protein
MAEGSVGKKCCSVFGRTRLCQPITKKGKFWWRVWQHFSGRWPSTVTLRVTNRHRFGHSGIKEELPKLWVVTNQIQEPYWPSRTGNPWISCVNDGTPHAPFMHPRCVDCMKDVLYISKIGAPPARAYSLNLRWSHGHMTRSSPSWPIASLS